MHSPPDEVGWSVGPIEKLCVKSRQPAQVTEVAVRNRGFTGAENRREISLTNHKLFCFQRETS